MQYLTRFAVDLTKLIGVAYGRANLSKEGLRELLTLCEPGEEQPLVKVPRELFRNFVAFERGTTRSHVLNLIKERVWPLMDSSERAAFFSSVVKEFLSEPENGFSQKSVVDAIDALHIPAGDLIWFLSSTLGLGMEDDNQIRRQDWPGPDKPLVMVSSILILSMRSLQRADASELEDGPGRQRAYFR